MSFWDRRENIKNKPSVELRTSRVIEKIMDDYEIPMGVAIEKLMREDGLYAETIEQLSKLYPDITS
ncbi:MAG: hypothetical protein V2A75_07910 [Pseudomonadota bacterium]